MMHALSWLSTVLKPTEEQAGLIRRPTALVAVVDAYLCALQIFDGRSMSAGSAPARIALLTPLTRKHVSAK